MKKEPLLVSSCLMGINCKYNGQNNFSKEIINLKDRFDFILICPEVLGGLGIPREKSEVVNDKVMTITGVDVTDKFKNGALMALDIAMKHNCKKAILKSKSPSCGKSFIYDGTFSNTIINKDGVCAKMLKENNIEIYTEKELDLI